MFNPGSFTRGKSRKKCAKRFLIVTNGSATECDYFNQLNRIAFDQVCVDTKTRGFSLEEMLEVAIKKKASGFYDIVCIVMDVDDYLKTKGNKKKLLSFLDNASASDINVYLSNESFEVWLCAHKVAISNSFGKRQKAAEVAYNNGMTYGNNHKHVVEEEITMLNIERAIKEIKRLRRQHKNKNVIDYKPSTDVDRLVAEITFK